MISFVLGAGFVLVIAVYVYHVIRDLMEEVRQLTILSATYANALLTIHAACQECDPPAPEWVREEIDAAIVAALRARYDNAAV